MSPKKRIKSHAHHKLSPNVKARARKFSQTNIFPQKKSAKTRKMNSQDMEALMDRFEKKFSEKQTKKLDELENNLGGKIESVSDEIKEIKEKQASETLERIKLGSEVVELREQIKDLTNRLDAKDAAPPPPPPELDIGDLASKVLPIVSNTFAKELKMSHIQNLVSEIKKTENSLMLFGYKPLGGPDIVLELRQKLLNDQLKVNFDVGHFSVEKIGRGEQGREVPLKLTFSSFSLRNQILQHGPNLPKGLKMEKCLPKEYRVANKEYLHLGWQLKQGHRNAIKTRVVLLQHVLCLQVKKIDKDGIKFDWSIHKEFVPPPDYCWR